MLAAAGGGGVRQGELACHLPLFLCLGSLRQVLRQPLASVSHFGNAVQVGVWVMRTEQGPADLVLVVRVCQRSRGPSC